MKRHYPLPRRHSGGGIPLNPVRHLALPLAMGSTLLALSAQAQLLPPTPAMPGAAPPVGVLPPPPPLVGQTPAEYFEQEVTIVEREDEIAYEYRVNGQLYMVKVVPDFGAPYYFLDTNGDGQLDAQSSDPRAVQVPMWILYRW